MTGQSGTGFLHPAIPFPWESAGTKPRNKGNLLSPVSSRTKCRGYRPIAWLRRNKARRHWKKVRIELSGAQSFCPRRPGRNNESNHHRYNNGPFPVRPGSESHHRSEWRRNVVTEGYPEPHYPGASRLPVRRQPGSPVYQTPALSSSCSFFNECAGHTGAKYANKDRFYLYPDHARNCHAT